jgi:dTMP kinase
MQTVASSPFITIEGGEGVGKSSAINCVEKVLQELHRPYVLTREPGGTEIAEAIRRVILQPHHETMAADTELLLVFASRAQHIAKVILPALQTGKVVVSDRFTDATYAYQGAGRCIPAERIAILEEWVQQGLQPDLTILLDAPIELGLERILSRGAKDRIEQEQLEFFYQVREGYLQRARAFPQRFKIVDASLPLSQVHAMITTIVAEYLKKW